MAASKCTPVGVTVHRTTPLRIRSSRKSGPQREATAQAVTRDTGCTVNGRIPTAWPSRDSNRNTCSSMTDLVTHQDTYLQPTSAVNHLPAHALSTDLR
jgi:hypothetical protein